MYFSIHLYRTIINYDEKGEFSFPEFVEATCRAGYYRWSGQSSIAECFMTGIYTLLYIYIYAFQMFMHVYLYDLHRIHISGPSLASKFLI